MLSTTAQLDYTLPSLTFDGITVSAPVLHIQSATVNDEGNSTVSVDIYASDSSFTAGDTPLSTASWVYAVTDGQTMAEVWTSLLAQTGLTDSSGNTITLTGATAIAGE